jgi:hypothetical protein
MNGEIKTFLNEGLKAYVDANATLTFFEQEMMRHILASLRQRAQWLPLKNHKIKPMGPGGDLNESSSWFNWYIDGQSPREELVRIDCGIWWNAWEKDGSAVVYASYSGEPKHLLKFNWSKKGQGIDSFEWRGRTILYLPVSDSNEIGKILNRLLDELLKQLGEK